MGGKLKIQFPKYIYTGEVVEDKLVEVSISTLVKFVCRKVCVCVCQQLFKIAFLFPSLFDGSTPLVPLQTK